MQSYKRDALRDDLDIMRFLPNRWKYYVLDIFVFIYYLYLCKKAHVPLKILQLSIYRTIIKRKLGMSIVSHI